MTPSTADTAAAWLADLWRSGRQAEALPPELTPSSIDEGYDIQDRLIALLGERVAGWKLGAGSPKLRAETGAGGSIPGRVLASRCHRPDAIVPLPDRAPVMVEFEIAFVLGRDLRPDAPIADPMAAVAETRVTFELVRSRFVDRRAVGWPSFAADNAAFEALVIGEPVAPTDLAALADSAIVLVDGVEQARRLTGEDATDPAQTYVDFVALARRRGMVLPEGSIISTGTVTRPFNIEGAVTITAGYLGRTMSISTRVDR